MPPRAQWADLPVRRGRDLYTGLVRDRPFVHNPHGHDALALLSRRADLWLRAADGRAAGEIAAELAVDAAAAQTWLSELPLLLRNGFLLAPGVRPWRPKGPGERVFHAWLHLTNACNLACPYCYIHKTPTHMGDAAVAHTLTAIEATARSGEVDRIHVRFAGGEPMLRFAAMQRFYEEATARCQAHGVRFGAAILTNGTVVPAGAVQWCRERGVQVSVSIDGVGPMQDVMRPVVGGGSSFARVEAGLDAWQAGGIRPYALVTVGASNLDGLPALASYLMQRQLGFRFSLVRDLEWGAGLLDDRHGAQAPHSYDATLPSGLLAGEPLRRLQRALGATYDLIEAEVGRGTLQPSFRRTHKFCDLEPWRPIAKACGAGETYVAISEQGEVGACQAALHHTGTRPLAASSLVAQARGQTQLSSWQRGLGNDECNRCRHKPSCAGGCPLLLHRREGHVDGRSPYCEVFRAVLPRILRIAALEMWVGRERQRTLHTAPPMDPPGP